MRGIAGVVGLSGVALAIGGVVLARSRAVSPDDPTRSRETTALRTWLALVAAGLLGVGLASHTFLRHTIQIVPIVLALAVSSWRSDWTAAAGAPLLSFWLLIMIAIWLYLLDIIAIITGTFSSAEITFTIVIGVAAVRGLLAAYRCGQRPSLRALLALAAGFATLQVIAMWSSMGA